MRNRPVTSGSGIPSGGAAESADSAGPVRLGRKTKDLVKRIGSGELAVIRHRNLDRIAAEDLVASGVKTVLNN